jgi:hypothetical protein
MSSLAGIAQAGSPFVRLDLDRGGRSSGTFVTDQLVLSCAHGKNAGDELTVLVNRTNQIRGRVIWLDRTKDLSFVEASGSLNGKPLTIARASPRPDATVIIAGYGGDSRLHERHTTVVGTRQGFPVTAKGEHNPFQWDYIQVYGNSRPGDSGGALIADGQLAGVIYGKALNNISRQKDSDGLIGGDCLCVPVEVVHEFIADWNDHLAAERRKAEEREEAIIRARQRMADWRTAQAKREADRVAQAAGSPKSARRR